MDVAGDVDWPGVIERLEGASAAQVVAVAADAARRCIVADGGAVTRAHLEASVSGMLRPT